MADQKDRIDELNEKLNLLLGKQKSFAQEIQLLHQEIQHLIKSGFEITSIPEKIEEPTVAIKPAVNVIETKNIAIEEVQKEIISEQVISPNPVKKQIATKSLIPKEKSNLEKFIGENLINKIGIAILVLGVAIGAKYSIENNLISPLTRIILGYLVGLGLIGFGIKLKAKYENYSAVLVSGALAILYFITFASYSFYGLFTQLMAFGLMLIFTAFGVVAALNYNKQIIAHIGLVGAYAVPFLLSNNSGNTLFLFSYMAIVNLGILIIAFKRYWKPLYYSSFIFTWLIFTGWIAFSYNSEQHFQLALTFASVFFALFYGIFLAYKLKTKEDFKKSDVVLLLLNSFIFYGFGYGLLSPHEIGSQLLGVFTLGNAAIHFGVSAILFKKKLADKNLFYLVSGLVLIFITIAVPVQLNGNWVTLIWAFEAALLFWIGRTKKVPIYEKLSYPLMLLAFFSLTQDWTRTYGAHNDNFKSILNIHFLSSLLFTASFGFILWVNQKTNTEVEQTDKNWLAKVMTFGIPVIFLGALFISFFLEIEHYWEKLFENSKIPALTGDVSSYPEYNYDLLDFSSIWLINYFLLFVSALAFITIKKIKNRKLGITTLILGLLAAFIFLNGGLYLFSELRQSFLNEDISAFGTSNFTIGIRYVSFGFFAIFLFAMFKLSKAPFVNIKSKIPFELLLHISILWILSSELLNWMDIAGSSQTYKLGLSILWGVYSLVLIALGIYKNKAYLRIGAIALFGVTLVKLFFYDIASMNTITKTIVFVSLGILLLIISFLYNKYKHKISDEPKD